MEYIIDSVHWKYIYRFNYKLLNNILCYVIMLIYVNGMKKSTVNVKDARGMKMHSILFCWMWWCIRNMEPYHWYLVETCTIVLLGFFNEQNKKKSYHCIPSFHLKHTEFISIRCIVGYIPKKKHITILWTMLRHLLYSMLSFKKS